MTHSRLMSPLAVYRETHHAATSSQPFATSASVIPSMGATRDVQRSGISSESVIPRLARDQAGHRCHGCRRSNSSRSRVAWPLSHHGHSSRYEYAHSQSLRESAGCSAAHPRQ